MLNNVTIWIEKHVIPQHWSPNSITAIGNLGVFVASFIFWQYGGNSYSDGTELPRWLFFLAAFAIQWFSWFDMMDG